MVFTRFYSWTDNEFLFVFIFCEGGKIPVTTCSLYIFYLTQFLVCFPGWSQTTCGFIKSSLRIGYELLASLSCMQKRP